MRFVYFGSFHISAAILEHLISAGFMPSAVVCNPDRPSGRKQLLTPPAVKKLILEKNWPIKILQPEQLKIGNLKLEIGEIDLALVMGYPKIIPQEVINLPHLGTIGVHPSLLPKYRGASPIQSALLAGESETGVTLYQMDVKMDHGPIIAQKSWKIEEGIRNPELEMQLAKVAGEVLAETLPKYVAGQITPREQDHSQATFTQKFTTADAQVNMAKDDPRVIYRKIKALNPEPGVWTMNFPGREGKRVKLLAADWHPGHPERSEGSLVIARIQPESKQPMDIN